MTCEIPRTYLPTPQLLNTGDSLPTVPTNPNDWDGMRRLLEAIRQSLGGTSGAQNTTAAPQVTNFVATSKTGGTLLTWDFNLNGGYYIIYRGTSNDLSAAFTCGIITEGNTRRGQFLDPCGQETAGTIIYYWIQPFTLGGIPGAMSFTTKACVDCAASTTFTDSLIGADQPFLVGDLWLPVFTITDTSSTGNSFAGGVNRGGTGLGYTNSTGAGFVPRGMAVPIGLNLAAIIAKKQFVQYKVVSNPAGISRPAGVCYLNANAGNWYEILMVTEVSQFAINRVVTGAGSALVVQSATTAYVNGDTLRMECDAVTTPGTTIINAYKNGVLKATFNDSSVNRLTTGTVGLAFEGSNPAVNVVISDFSGGSF